jgi:hypothetical protein
MGDAIITNPIKAITYADELVDRWVLCATAGLEPCKEFEEFSQWAVAKRHIPRPLTEKST